MISKEKFFAEARVYSILKRHSGFDWMHIPIESGVYAIMDGDECVYIGQTANLKHRMVSHAAGSGCTELRKRMIAMREARVGKILFLDELNLDQRLLWEAELQEQIPVTLGDARHRSASLRRVTLSQPVREILLKYMAQKKIHSVTEALEQFFKEGSPFLLP